MNSISQDPSFFEYFRVFDREPAQIERPIEALGEKKAYALQMLNSKIACIMHAGARKVDPPQSVRNVIADMILKSEVIFMGFEMVTLLATLQEKIKASMKGMNSITPRKLPYSKIWLTAPKGFITNIEAGGIPHEGSFDAYLQFEPIIVNKIEINSFGFRTEKDRVEILASNIFPHATEALCLLLEEKIVRTETFHCPRQIRKGIKSIGGRHDEAVRVLKLRSYESSATDSKGGSFEYAHRWIVRGHLRNQYFPSDKSHRLIWIDPYAKGPEDAPFLETIKAVIR